MLFLADVNMVGSNSRLIGLLLIEAGYFQPCLELKKVFWLRSETKALQLLST